MIKKLSLYGLCFNLGAAFAVPPTQAELEAFIATQGDNIKVRRTSFGTPDRITLKNEAAYKAWEDFSKWHRDSFGFWSCPEIPEEECISEQRIACLERMWFVFKNRVPEERRECFQKFSGKARPEELALVDGWGVKGLRIIDFNSIVEGLEDEAQKAEARRLMADDEALEAAVDQWVNTYCMHDVYDAEIFTFENPYTEDETSAQPSEKIRVCIGSFPYKLSPETTDQMKGALRAMSRHESARGILVLSLVLVKPWGIKALSLPSFDDYILNPEKASLLSLCYDLQEMLYNQLGICGNYSLLGDLGSDLERGLFRLGSLPADAESIKIPSALFQRLLYENYGDDSLDLVEIPQQKFFRAAQIVLLWSNFEEIWYRIGFANVDDVIYVNRMSGMNLLDKSVLFRGGCPKFTDLKDLFGLDIDLSSYPLINQFLRDMDLAVEKDLPSLYPTKDAWKVWLQLQGRTDAGCLPLINKSREELIAELLSIELIGERK